MIGNIFRNFLSQQWSPGKVKDFHKLSNKEIYFTFQSNSAKYNKTFKFISWPNFLEGLHILTLDIWGKTFTDCFKK